MSIAARDQRRRLPVQGLALVAAGLVAIDIVRLIALPQANQESFTNGFEVVVAVLCFLACTVAAARSGGGERTVWSLVAAYFVLLAVADLHDFIVTTWGPAWPVLLGALELFGWLAYLPVVLLCVAPVGDGGAPAWRKAVPLLDFLQVTLVLSVAYYAYVYAPHLVARTTWETVGRPELIRNVAICVALLARAVGDPRSRTRTLFAWVAAVNCLRTVFQTGLFHSWAEPVQLVGRPLSFMIFAIFATQWRSLDTHRKPEAHAGWRELATRWMLGVLPAGAPIFVAVVAERRPQDEAFLWPVFLLSLALFIFRTGLAEYERLRAAQVREAEEEALAKSEAKLRAVMDTSFDAVVMLDADRRVTYVSPSHERFTGYTPDEIMQIIGGFALDHLHPDDRGPLLERFRGAVQVPGARTTAEFRLRHKQGHWFWVETAVVNLLGDPNVQAIVVTSRDIDERKRAEERLRYDETLLRHVLDTSPAVIFVKDRDSNILLANSKMASFYNLSVEEVTGQRQSDLHAAWGARPEEVEKWLADDREVIDAGTAKHLVETGTDSNNRLLWFETGKYPIQIGEDRQGVLVISEDITERKRAEEALAENEARFRAVVENSHDGIVMLDADRHIKYVSPSYTRLTGYASEELTGKHGPDYLHPEDHVVTAAKFDSVLRAPGATATTQYRLRHKLGHWVWIESTAVNSLNDPHLRAVVVTSRDITERRDAESRLLHVQKLEAVGRLASGVAHDFNNILQAMMMTSQLLRLSPHGRAGVETTIGELEELVKRATALTRQLLIFSRQDAGKRETLDLGNMVRDLMTMLRRVVRENVTLTLELAPEPLPVDADRGQLDQVLINLVVNACDAMLAGGKLAIRTGATNDEWVWLAVEDTGQGIPESIRDRIFEPFFTSKEASRGTGLGLSVVHGIVTAYGGKVEVESAVGEGSTFTIVLPRGGSGEVSAVEPAPQDGIEMPRGEGERILVVEDEDTARESLRGILVGLGYDVVAVASGEEAGRLRAEPRFDVLLTDLVLPGVAGPDLARGLVERWPELKVILMSGYAGDEMVRSGIAAGEVRFLQKPFDMTALAQEVSAALRERPRHDADHEP